ncbi:MAG: GNAT family N-acetyltransferase [Candidatus Hydrogenedentes bacterium]|nr:GNAT family N-acetyltransferase [Candidatus Hydrogenedentota bacterium]
MTGPRPVRVEELPSLRALVNSVFLPDSANDMFQFFPQLFNEQNCGNLLVFEEAGRVISHVGRTQRWASLAGSLVQVACIGAVSTYPEYRNQHLASTLLQSACDQAIAAGVDFMMISGGLGMYRRVGAADVGRDHRVSLRLDDARRLPREDLSIAPFSESDIEFCERAYARKSARFVRTRDDWEWFLRSRSCMTHIADLWVVRVDDVPCAYIASYKPADDSEVFVVEHAGDETAVAGALWNVAVQSGADSIGIHVQAEEPYLRQRLVDAGGRPETNHSMGTLLLLNIPQLIERMRPWFETRIGMKAAHDLRVTQDGEAVTFSVCGESCTVSGKAAAAEFIFGNHDRAMPDGLLGRVFPIPGLWYGLNYV